MSSPSALSIPSLPYFSHSTSRCGCADHEQVRRDAGRHSRISRQRERSQNVPQPRLAVSYLPCHERVGQPVRACIDWAFGAGRAWVMSGPWVGYIRHIIHAGRGTHVYCVRLLCRYVTLLWIQPAAFRVHAARHLHLEVMKEVWQREENKPTFSLVSSILM